MWRAWIVWGSLFTIATGCQTFNPYGYPNDYVGPYGGGTNAGPSTYAPNGTTLVPTPSPATQYPRTVPGTALPRGTYTNAYPQSLPPQILPGGVPSSKPVPNYNNSRDPTTLGTPEADSQDDFKKSSSNSNRPNGVRLSSITDDSEENLASLGDEGFAKPIPVTTVSNSTPTHSRISPYRKDRNGYSWLRGTVIFDDTEQQWRLTYNPEPTANDPYQGNFILLGSDVLDSLLPDDVVFVEGSIDPTHKDKRFGKPSYRVRQLKRLEPLGDD